MLKNNQPKGRSDAGSLAVKDQVISEIVKMNEERLNNGLKWSSDYFDHDQTNIQLQIVPEINKEEEGLKQDLLVVVPDEHSETGDHSHINDYYHRCRSRNSRERLKRRSIQILSDDESDEFTREVPSMIRKESNKRRRRRSGDDMSDKMRTLQQLVPNCYKTDKVAVLDEAIEYMKNLQIQLKVMSLMGLNSYFLPATLDFGMHNHMLTAMAMAHGINIANPTTLSPLIPRSNWLLPPFANLSLPHSSSSASSPQCPYGFGPCFPSFREIAPEKFV